MRAAVVNVRWTLLLALNAFLTTPSSAQTSPSQRIGPQHAAAPKLTITVTDENGVAVSAARVDLEGPAPTLPLRCETDFAGRCEFSNLSGSYELHVAKTGFYAVLQSRVQASIATSVDVTLSRQQEAHEVVNVTESAPAIDREQISA